MVVKPVVNRDEIVDDFVGVDFYLRHAKRLGDLDFSGKDGVSLTRQEFAEECDINTIMDRYQVTGMLPVTARPLEYKDWTEIPDLQTAMTMFNAARDAFMTLPARVRAEFDNSPEKFVEFAQDPKNLDQMGAWGLAEKAAPPPPPQRVEIVNPPAAPPVPPDGKKP